MTALIIKSPSSLSAPLVGTPYLPDIQSDLSFRIRCSDFFYSNGATVTSLISQDGSGDSRAKTFDRVNPSGTSTWSPPVWATGGPNGKPWLQFDGSMGLANGLNETEQSEIAQPTTLYVVARVDDFPAVRSNERILGGMHSLSLHNIMPQLSGSNRRIEFSAGTTVQNSLNMTDDAWFFAIVVFNGAAGKHKVNGGPIAEANMGTQGYRGLAIGRNNSPLSGTGLVGGIAEFGMYARALSDQDIDALYADMAERYAIS